MASLLSKEPKAICVWLPLQEALYLYFIFCMIVLFMWDTSVLSHWTWMGEALTRFCLTPELSEFLHVWCQLYSSCLTSHIGSECQKQMEICSFRNCKNEREEVPRVSANKCQSAIMSIQWTPLSAGRPEAHAVNSGCFQGDWDWLSIGNLGSKNPKVKIAPVLLEILFSLCSLILSTTFKVM